MQSIWLKLFICVNLNCYIFMCFCKSPCVNLLGPNVPGNIVKPETTHFVGTFGKLQKWTQHHKWTKQCFNKNLKWPKAVCRGVGFCVIKQQMGSPYYNINIDVCVCVCVFSFSPPWLQSILMSSCVFASSAY